MSDSTDDDKDRWVDEGVGLRSKANTAREHAGLRASLQADPFSPFPAPVMRPGEWPVGTVLGFTKQYSEDGPTYSFAAIRATGGRRGWFLSGPRNAAQPLDWDGLLDFIGCPDDWARVGVAGSWSPLVGS